jgi:HSP20 family protein
MALMQRTRDELEWPTLFGRFTDWPDSWKEMFEESRLKVEEYDEDGYLVVRAEMPGIDPDEDVEITVSDHTLHLRAERRAETKREDANGYRSEFRYGSFSRTVALPAGASDDDVTASYVDGILEVRIPIDDEAAEAKKIPITRN